MDSIIAQPCRHSDFFNSLLLAEAASAMLLRSKKWCALKAWGIRLASKIGMSKAIVAVARKLAIVMHKMWLTGEPFRFGAATAENAMP